MLDERIFKLAQETSDAELRDTEESHASRVKHWKVVAHGQGRQFLGIADVYKREVASRAMTIWRSLQRAHSSYGGTLTDSLRADLGVAFHEQLERHVAELHETFHRDMAECPPGANLARTVDNAVANALKRHAAEIEHYVASLEVAADRGRDTGTGYHFYGTVGAVVAASGATAHVVQHIGVEQRDALLAALQLGRDVLSSAATLSPQDRQDWLEIADDVEKEAKKERPNTRRLSQALQNVAAAVQGIANGAPAYDALRAAGMAIGLF